MKPTVSMALGTIVLPLALLSPAVLSGQTDAGPGADPVSASLMAQFDLVRNATVAAAESMPESLYDFRATDEVRTFGQLVGHIANAQYTICSGLLDEPSPASGNLEELTAKSDLVDAITASWDYCRQAYEVATDDAMGDQVDFFGGRTVRHYPMSFALIHAYEHYGNMVTYMRLNGRVPPTSQGQ